MYLRVVATVLSLEILGNTDAYAWVCQYGSTALLLGAKHADVVCCLVERGANVNVRNGVS